MKNNLLKTDGIIIIHRHKKDIERLVEEELIQQIKTIYDSNSVTQVESFATVKLTNLKTFLDKTVKDNKNTSLSRRSALRKMESLLQQYSASGSSISSVANEYERHVPQRSHLITQLMYCFS